MTKSEKGSEKTETDREDKEPEATPREKRKRDILYGKGGELLSKDQRVCRAETVSPTIKKPTNFKIRS